MTHSAPLTSRHGGDLVVESLQALGVRTMFGVPGQHCLAVVDALRRHRDVQLLSCRTELAAAFAADGYARVTRSLGVVLLSTGPGALQSLAALQEAAAASIPVLVVASQIPRAGLGGRRRGYLHELKDQSAAARVVAKDATCVQHGSQIPAALAEAAALAMSAPAGPVWVEIPEDVLREPTSLPPVTRLHVMARHPAPHPGLIDEAAQLLTGARAPVILSGGGVIRAGANAQLVALSERLQAPVAMTYGGKGAMPWDHALSLQSWMEDRALTELLEDADVLLCVGTGLGELSSNYHTIRPRGRVIQIEADLGKLEANVPALGIHADAGKALTQLLNTIEPAHRDGKSARDKVANLHRIIRDRLSKQDLHHEQALLAAIRDGVPDNVDTIWDMTIAAYWAWSTWDCRAAGQMLSAQGAGGLGYAFPAAIGVAAAGRPVLAISGDGGAAYGLAELAVARQHNLPVTWLIVDDGGYGILAEYQTERFGEAYETTLATPDYVRLANAFGVPARQTSPQALSTDLQIDLEGHGPSVLHLRTKLHMFAPT